MEGLAGSVGAGRVAREVAESLGQVDFVVIGWLLLLSRLAFEQAAANATMALTPEQLAQVRRGRAPHASPLAAAHALTSRPHGVCVRP